MLETWTNPETVLTEPSRKVFIRSSSLAEQQYRLRQRRLAKAGAELNEGVGKRWRGKPPMAAPVEARALAVLERHQVRRFIRVHVELGDEVPELHCEWDEEALARERRLDGRSKTWAAHYVLSTRAQHAVLKSKKFNQEKADVPFTKRSTNTNQKQAPQAVTTVWHTIRTTRKPLPRLTP